MNSKELLNLKLSGRQAERNLFCPAIYEHKAKLIDKPVSEVACSVKLLTEAIKAEYEIYKPDMLTVGIDVYNIEAEAVGSKVLFPDAKDAVPVIRERILDSTVSVEKLQHFDVEKTARMPLFLEAAQEVNDKLGDCVPVRGAVSGPYSMAAELLGIENLITVMLTETDRFNKLMDFCTDVSIDFGRAFIKRGLSICVFDSQASPPLLSPGLYEKHILPRAKQINNAYKKAGCELTEYVVGGKTNDIAKAMSETGFDIVLSDFTSDVNKFLEASKGKKQLIRRNISPILIEQGPQEQLNKQVEQVKNLAAEHSNIIIGTGVISYNVAIEDVLKVKEMCIETN